jgi:glutamine amidotransferase PdxT
MILLSFMLDKLMPLDGQLVTVVRPYFGSQSDAFDGELSVIRNKEIIFQVSLTSVPISTIFKLSDVDSVIINPSNVYSHPTPIAVIRLKRPEQYYPDWNHA